MPGSQLQMKSETARRGRESLVSLVVQWPGAGLVVSSQSQVPSVLELAVAAVKNCPGSKELTLGFLWESKRFLSGFIKHNMTLKPFWLGQQ